MYFNINLLIHQSYELTYIYIYIYIYGKLADRSRGRPEDSFQKQLHRGVKEDASPFPGLSTYP